MLASYLVLGVKLNVRVLALIRVVRCAGCPISASRSLALNWYDLVNPVLVNDRLLAKKL